jgi:cation diffusion facilitator CzcD-associated flavoprotein CzcO
MGLDVLLNTEVLSVKYDAAQQRYTVETRSNGGSRILTARHVVLATGSFSEDIKVPDIPGKDSFEGRMYHSKHHVSAEEIDGVRDKKVVVIGTATSGHDIAEDFVLGGAKQVSMIQRHATFVVSSESFSGIQLGLWNMDGLSTEEADLVGNSIPLAVIRTMSIDTTKMMAANDKTMLDGLRQAGMAIKTGEDGVGLADHQLIKGGHFYIDQGASQMIIDGKIKLHRCEQGVREIRPNGLVLADGAEIDADVIVFATGYSLNIGNVERIMGKDIADRLPEFGLLDPEQERAGVSPVAHSFLQSFITMRSPPMLTTKPRALIVVEGNRRARVLVHDGQLHVVSPVLAASGAPDRRRGEGIQQDALCIIEDIKRGTSVCQTKAESQLQLRRGIHVHPTANRVPL